MEVIRDTTPDLERRKFLRHFTWGEWAGIALIIALAAVHLALSWRKWNHPLIDFGRELYTAWRLANGAVLYRDVDSVYGPLSQYLNAGLFRLFGPGLMVLATANLVVLIGIVVLAYFVFRQAWGALGAIVGCATFVAVFAFSQYLSVSNFNYVTPYSHEVTHGVFLSLLLVRLTTPWINRPTVARSFFVGLTLGLAFITKPEFILAGSAVVVAAALMQGRRSRRLPVRACAGFALGLVLPTLGFACFFAQYLGWSRGLSTACNAWMSVLENPIVKQDYQWFAMGLDEPWRNLLLHGKATVVGFVIFAGLGMAVRFISKIETAKIRIPLFGAVFLTTVAVGVRVEWIHIGVCLLGLNLLYLAVAGRSWLREEGQVRESDLLGRRPWRLLITVLAIALMARMVLNGRIYQFGFYQAALAAMVIVAVIFTERPKSASRTEKNPWVHGLLAGALVVPGILALSVHSWSWLRKETHSVADGRDKFYSFPPTMEGTGEVVMRVVEVLRQFPAGSSLLALPEGGMINYLARMPCPLPQFQFYSFTTEGGLERSVVAALERSPPDLIVIASRDLNDFGIARYGAGEGNGREILQWILRNYTQVFHVGGDPLSSDQRGGYVLKRNAPGVSKAVVP